VLYEAIFCGPNNLLLANKLGEHNRFLAYRHLVASLSPWLGVFKSVLAWYRLENL